MAMTSAQIITEICDVVGKSTTASAVSATELQVRVLNYLNMAQQRIARAYSFNELKTIKTDSVTVDTVKTYPLETGTNNLGLTGIKDIESIRLIDSENSRKLKRWSYRKYDKKFPYPENYSTDRPHMYVRYGDNIELFKIPNDAYTLYIRYSKWATALTNTATSPDFLEKDQLLIAAGVLETYLAFEEYVDAKIWYERYSGLLYDAISGDSTMTDWDPLPEGFGEGSGAVSGAPWLDPYGESGDPLAGYP